jgi:hypothetical protein
VLSVLMVYSKCTRALTLYVHLCLTLYVHLCLCLCLCLPVSLSIYGCISVSDLEEFVAVFQETKLNPEP